LDIADGLQPIEIAGFKGTNLGTCRPVGSYHQANDNYQNSDTHARTHGSPLIASTVGRISEKECGK
jgi:hypothetical protein